MAVFTANYGNTDDVSRPVAQSVECDFLIYGADADGWTRRALPNMKSMSNIERSRVPKILASTMLPEYDVTIWACGLVQITSGKFVEWCIDQLQEADIIFFRHSNKPSVKSEIDRSSGYHGCEYLDGMKQYYRNFDCDVPAPCCNLIVRKKTKEMVVMESMWLLHNLLWVTNDQISMPIALQSTSIPWRFIAGDIFDNLHWRRRHSHRNSSNGHTILRACDAEEL